MHKFFLWDDSKAAAKYREDQARTLISSFDITVKVSRTEYQIQQFVHATGNTPGYTEFSRVKTDKDLAQAFMAEQLRVVHGIVHKVRNYAELLGFESDIAKLTVEVDELFERVQMAAAA